MAQCWGQFQLTAEQKNCVTLSERCWRCLLFGSGRGQNTLSLFLFKRGIPFQISQTCRPCFHVGLLRIQPWLGGDVHEARCALKGKGEVRFTGTSSVFTHQPTKTPLLSWGMSSMPVPVNQCDPSSIQASCSDCSLHLPPWKSRPLADSPFQAQKKHKTQEGSYLGSLDQGSREIQSEKPLFFWAVGAVRAVLLVQGTSANGGGST